MYKEQPKKSQEQTRENLEHIKKEDKLEHMYTWANETGTHEQVYIHIDK